MDSCFLQAEICLWQFLINYKSLSEKAKWHLHWVQFVLCRSLLAKLENKACFCFAWPHLASPSRDPANENETRQTACHFRLFINYTRKRKVTEKNPEKQTFRRLLAGTRRCFSSLKWQLIWKRVTPGFPPTLILSLQFLPSERWLTHQGGWNQISSLLVNHMWIFGSLRFSQSSPSAEILLLLAFISCCQQTGAECILTWFACSYLHFPSQSALT